MKRYSFKSDPDYACTCHREEALDGKYVLYSDAQARIEALEDALLEEREGRGRGDPDLLTTAYMSGAQDYRATVRQLYSKVEALEWLVEVQEYHLTRGAAWLGGSAKAEISGSYRAARAAAGN